MKVAKSITLVFLMFLASEILAQETFRFGVSGGFGLSQIEGDNLKGFRKASYETSLLGGFLFKDRNEIIVALGYEQLGSKRKGEDAPRISGNYLSEIDMSQMSLFVAYAKPFNQDWDGSYKLRAKAGLKYNRLLSHNARLVSSSIVDDYELADEDFNSSYLSLRLGIGAKIGSRFLLEVNYEHALQSIIKDSEEIRLNKLIPFGLSVGLSYYLF